MDPLTPEQIRSAEAARSSALQLLNWFEAADLSGGFSDRFELVRAFNRPATAYGFCGDPLVDGRVFPAMGLVQEVFYDRVSASEIAQSKAQLREFVLRYFLRIADFRQPEASANGDGRAAARLLGDIGQSRVGFGYTQQHFKLRADGSFGNFPVSHRFAIVDLRELASIYEWVLARVQIFDFGVDLYPLGPQSVGLRAPIRAENTILLTDDFFISRENPSEGVLAEYGLGYGLVPNDDPAGIFAYGPGHFTAGFQRITFRLLETGEIRVRMTFVANRPDRLLNLPYNPLDWGLRIADLMSLGLANRVFSPLRNALDDDARDGAAFDPIDTMIGLSEALRGPGGGAAGLTRSGVQKELLVRHFMQHYQMIVGSLLTWRQLPDWSDEKHIPSWVAAGVSS